MSSRAIHALALLALLMFAALSAFSLAATDDLTFQAIMSPRQTKLFQYPEGAYSVEVVEITGEKARFFINGEELTQLLAKGDEHKTADNSTIEITLIKQQQDTVKFLFFGSGNDPLPASTEGYAVRTIPTQYDYPGAAPVPSPAPLRNATVTPPQPIEAPAAAEEARPPTEESAAENEEEKEEQEENVIAIEGESETFSIGWMNRLWDWIRGLFS